MLEHGIYRTLIDWYYLDEQPIPLEVDVVSRRMRLSTEEELKSLKLVLFDFFEKTDKGHKHKRINMEIKDFHENAAKNKANGMLGGRPKKTQSVILGNPNETQVKGNHKPLTINQEPITKEIQLPDGVSVSTWTDFVKLRKAKKSPITNTAILGITREAEKVGWSLEQALSECCSRGWIGFKGDWVVGKQTSFVKQKIAGAF